MFEVDTEVIVIGNGPAGISLSAFLSGWLPYYSLDRPHPNQFIHENLAENSQLSLLDQDLSWYRPEYEQHASASVGLYSDLMDRLMRPEGSEPSTVGPCLDFEFCPARRVPHVVLGDGPIGGSWNRYDDNMATVSLCTWMDLPGYSLANFLGGQSLIARLPAGLIREYFKAYAKKMGLEENFAQYTTVTNVMKFCSDVDQKEYWKVSGYDQDGNAFSITSKRIVLACGRSHHRQLDVPGENNAMNLVYTAKEMRQVLHEIDENSFNNELDLSNRPVLVVGDGISAADSIMSCLKMGIPVIHVFRRSERELKNTMLARLSSSVYPEYAEVFSLMIGRSENPLYTKMSCSTVQRIFPNASAEIQRNSSSHQMLDYRCIVICVGLRTELSMLEDKYNFQADYEAEEDPTLFAIGSVIGDHFVRYLVGGALKVAQRLQQQHKADMHASAGSIADSVESEQSHASSSRFSEILGKSFTVPRIMCKWFRLPCSTHHSSSGPLESLS
ncbi:unnamed protein product [Bursaphelenchus xylophilus]|uniref:(pine wood nematode) hypothetical protein n=1 Tax=Bursaphelenchus xylophilus TaxID=6326 RepID=A0A1I7RUE5_BURXY|nr:unnamed protein product [Bursaphelenchus xylophilus]CAG9114070.1 unnamed protein product [Bursaphelenchus xylophilus]